MAEVTIVQKVAPHTIQLFGKIDVNYYFDLCLKVIDEKKKIKAEITKDCKAKNNKNNVINSKDNGAFECSCCCSTKDKIKEQMPQIKIRQRKSNKVIARLLNNSGVIINFISTMYVFSNKMHNNTQTCYSFGNICCFKSLERNYIKLKFTFFTWV